MEELPFGTRGGLAVRSDFPLDGEYVVKVELAGAARAAAPARDHRGWRAGATGHRSIAGPAAGRAAGRRRRIGLPLKPTRVSHPGEGRPRLIGVTFVEQNEARDEETLRPRMRSRGTQPAIASVTISGPYNAKGPGDTPSRRRIFVVPPGDGRRRAALREADSVDAGAPGLPAAGHDADVERLLPFYTPAGRKAASISAFERALERLLVSPQFLFRIERDPAGIAPGTPYRISDLELASRLSFFLWSSIPDDELLDVGQPREAERSGGSASSRCGACWPIRAPNRW